MQLTKNTQPAILLVSYSIFKVLIQEFNFNLKTFKCFAGHSLGEYSALVCAILWNLKMLYTCFKNVVKLCKKAVPVGEGTMIAVLGAEINAINALLNN